jgi:hypothetical protein
VATVTHKLNLKVKAGFRRMTDDQVQLSFEGTSRGQAGVLAVDLEAFLQEHTEVDLELRRNDADAQDFGATLVLILGTASVKVVAQAIGLWVQRHREAEGHLKIGDVEVELTNVDTKTLSSLLGKALEAARR